VYKRSKSRACFQSFTLASNRTLTAKFEGVITISEHAVMNGSIVTNYDYLQVNKALPFDLFILLSRTGESQDQSGNISSESESREVIISAGQTQSQKYLSWQIQMEEKEQHIEIYNTSLKYENYIYDYYPSQLGSAAYPLNFTYTHNNIKYSFQINGY